MSRSARVSLACLAAAGLLAGAASAGSGSMTATCVKVLDGDTLIIECDRGRQTVELVGIDAPELDQAWGKQVRSFVRDIVRGQELEVELVRTDGDATVARVLVAGRDLSEMLVGTGLAWVVDGAADPELEDLCSRARELPCGLWLDAEPVPPWEFRAVSS